MRDRDIKIARKYDALDRCKEFEADLLKIKDIVTNKSDDGIPFDLTGFLSDIKEVIIVPEYDIRADRDDYWDARDQLIASVVELAKIYDLHRTSDRIEDQGAHFYFVFSCGKSWREFWEAKSLIERFAEVQKSGNFNCPRCGLRTMNPYGVLRNALSRRVSVHICDCCGVDEAIEDMNGAKTCITDWAIIKNPALFEIKESE